MIKKHFSIENLVQIWLLDYKEFSWKTLPHKSIKHWDKSQIWFGIVTKSQAIGGEDESWLTSFL